MASIQSDSERKHIPYSIKAAELKYLPMTLSLENAEAVVIDYFRVADFPKAYDILNACRERRDNVALTEFDEYEEWVEGLAFTWMFSIKRREELVGVFSLGPYRCSRSCHPGSTEFYIYLKPEVRESALVPVFTLAEKFALDLDVCYFSMTYTVFYTNLDTVMTLKQLGYAISAIIPHSGVVKGKGLVESLVMTKFIEKPIPLTRYGETLQLFAGLGYQDPDREATFDREFRDYPKFPGLPQDYTALNGTVVTLRNLEVRDHRWLYGLMNASVERGDGYTIDDFGPYQYFRETTLIVANVVVIEFPGKGQVAAVMMMPSPFQRGREKLILDTNMIVDPKSKGLGIGKDLTDLWIALGKELKYKACATSIVLNNHRTFALARYRDLSYFGTLPATGNMKGVGWIDASVCYKNLDECQSFTELKAIRDKEAAKRKAKL